MHRPLPLALLGALLAAPAIAQGPLLRLPDHAASPFLNVGFARGEHGELLGVGPDYLAVIGRTGLRYTPALGKAAPHDLPLTYELLAIGRGEASQPVAAGEPTITGNLAVSAHGPVTAIHELRTDGIEQSFVFTQLPAGDGDLIVRGRIDTELAAGEVTADGVACTLPGIGGVHIGAVSGHDAAGHRTAGQLRLVGHTLEFVLPAAFVDQAVLPITVDPLLSTVTVLGGGNNDLVPDVAYDATTDSYLVVWQRELSLINQDLRAQRIAATGTLIGATLAIESSTTVSSSQVTVANINLRDAFVVAWVQAGDIVARGVDAATGAMTAAVNVAATTDTETAPDLAGEANGLIDDDALCVWQNSTGGDIQACQITYTAAATLTVAAPVTFSNGLFNTLSNPCISHNSGGLGNHLICWQSYGSISGTYDVVGTVVNRNLGSIAAPFTISSSTRSETNPDCDGSGDNNHWVVAVQRAESTGSTTDIFAYPVSLAGITPVIGTAVTIDAISGMDERDPAVCQLQNSVLVGWAKAPTPGHYITYVASLDQERCAYCEGNWNVENLATTSANFVAIAWRNQSAANDNDDALVAWQSFDLASNTGDIKLRQWTAIDGRVDYLSASCGVGGHLHAGCPRAPNPDFHFELRQAAASTPAFLLLSPSRVNLYCGPCTLIPDPYQGFVAGSLTTNANGSVLVPVPIPQAINGLQIYAQWALLGTVCSSGFDLSDGAVVTVQ